MYPMFLCNTTFLIVIVITPPPKPTSTTEKNTHTPDTHYTCTYIYAYTLTYICAFQYLLLLFQHSHYCHFIIIDCRLQTVLNMIFSFFCCTLTHIYKPWHPHLIKMYLKRISCECFDCWYGFKSRAVQLLKSDTSYSRYTTIHLIRILKMKCRNIYQHWHKQLFPTILSMPQCRTSARAGSCYVTGITYFLYRVFAERICMAMLSSKLNLHSYTLYAIYVACNCACLQMILLLKCCLIVCCQCKIHNIPHHIKIHRCSCVDNNILL